MAILIAIAFLIVHFVCARGVYHEAMRLENNGQRVLFVDATLWTLSTFVIGPLGALSFWLMHLSTLTNPNALQVVSTKDPQQNPTKMNTDY